MEKYSNSRKLFEKLSSPKLMDAEQLIYEFSKYLKSFVETLANKNYKKFELGEDLAIIEKDINEKIPVNSTSIEEVMQIVSSKLIPRFNYENIRFMGFIPRSPTNEATFGEAIASFYNQFLGAAIASPAATAIEALTIKWIGEILGFSGDFFGTYSIGGSSANLEGIHTGLVAKLPWDVKASGVIGAKKPIIYTSDQAHMCITKAVKLLGLGTDNLKRIPSDKNYELDIDYLKKEITKDKESDELLPIMIVASAGTTNTGAIDDIEALSQIASESHMWLHVDAAYGGFAILAKHEISNRFRHISLADSVVVDTHKWFYTPLEGGCLIVKDATELHNTYDETADYLSDSRIDQENDLVRDFSSYGYALSRKWRGLMVWMNFKLIGMDGISNLITRNILLAEYFKSKIIAHEKFELVEPTNLGIVCFRVKGDSNKNSAVFSKMMGEGKFVIGRTVLNNQPVLRICILNTETTPQIVDELLISLDKNLAMID